MIKPGTVCMIRGVPQGMPGYDCIGKIVQVEKLVFGRVWQFSPTVTTHIPYSMQIDTGEERFLHPLDDFEDDLNREALDEVLERTFRETLEKKLAEISTK